MIDEYPEYDITFCRIINSLCKDENDENLIWSFLLEMGEI